MSTWSELYFESDASVFPSEQWGLVFRMPWYIGTDYLDFFGWDNPGLKRRFSETVMNSQEFHKLPDDVSDMVRSKKGGHYRFTLTGDDFLEGALDLQKYWISKNKWVSKIDQDFLRLAIDLITTCHANSINIRVIHIVS